MTDDCDIYNNPPVEVIRGQIVAKANNYQAVPDGRGSRRMIKSDKVRAYERSFLSQCVKYAGAMISTPFELEVTVYYRANIYDLDNSLKTLLDCLQYAGAIKDDNLCRRITANKKIDKYNPRVEFSLKADMPPPSLFDFDNPESVN